MDGVAGCTARGGVFKIDLYRVMGVKDDTELRTVTHRLVVPGMALNEFSRLLDGLRQAAKEAAEGRDTS